LNINFIFTVSILSKSIHYRTHRWKEKGFDEILRLCTVVVHYYICREEQMELGA